MMMSIEAKLQLLARMNAMRQVDGRAGGRVLIGARVTAVHTHTALYENRYDAIVRSTVQLRLRRRLELSATTDDYKLLIAAVNRLLCRRCCCCCC